MGYDGLVFFVLAILALAAATLWARRPGSWLPSRLVVAGAALHIVGSLARYETIYRFYNGLGDAVKYFYDGLEIADGAVHGSIPLFSPSYWFTGTDWWGTLFLTKISGLVLVFIGESLRAEFLIFALFGFAGLYFMAQAFRNVQPNQSVELARWLFFWPSLWFWPSSVGKEAILTLAIGLTVLGYAGRPGGAGIRWIPFAAGLGLSFCIRPHVTVALGLAALVAHWLGSWRRWSPRRVLEAALAVVLLAFAMNGMKAQFGLADADLEGLTEFVQYRAGQTLEGGSNIGAPPLSPLSLPIVFANVWMRPFPWDVHNATSLVSFAEIAVLWVMFWRRRKGMRTAIRLWRQHRLLRFAVPFTLVYTLMIGFAFGNLGIIARQRSLVFPFMFMILVAVPARAKARQESPERAAGTAPERPPRPFPQPSSAHSSPAR